MVGSTSHLDESKSSCPVCGRVDIKRVFAIVDYSMDSDSLGQLIASMESCGLALSTLYTFCVFVYTRAKTFSTE